MDSYLSNSKQLKPKIQCFVFAAVQTLSLPLNGVAVQDSEIRISLSL